MPNPDPNFKPRSMDWVAGELGSPVDGKIETCSIVYPKYDLGHQEWIPRRGPLSDIPHLVYATIDAKGDQRARVTAFPRLLDDMPLRPDSARPLPLE